MEGTFEGWLSDGAFGIIRPSDNSGDVFLHKSKWRSAEQLVTGAIVEFEFELDTEGRRSATTVASFPAPSPLSNTIAHPEPSHLKPSEGFVTKYLYDKGYGFIGSEDVPDPVFVHYSELSSGIQYLRVGDQVSFRIRRTDRGPKAVQVRLTERAPPQEGYIYHYACMPQSWPRSLANLAEHEQWDYNNSKSTVDLPILRSYLQHTFYRLVETEGICTSNDHTRSAFNTGLVTSNQEDIYCMFNREAGGDWEWVFEEFYKASDRGFHNYFGGRLPPLAEYFDNAADLLFDRRLRLSLDIDHILENIGRFPTHLQENQFLARSLLVSAEAQTKKRVYRNYKTAIPQYFRPGARGPGKLQLLLPICLEDPARADLALTVDKNREGNAYLSSTILTLDMAYCNARLLARPDTEWLRP